MEYMLTFHILNVYVDKTQPRQFKFTFKAILKRKKLKKIFFNLTSDSVSPKVSLKFTIISQQLYHKNYDQLHRSHRIGFVTNNYYYAIYLSVTFIASITDISS